MNKLKKIDIIIILILLITAILGFLVYLFYSRNIDVNNVVITVDGDVYKTIPLDNNCTVDVYDNSGNITNTIVVNDKSVYMQHANCPDKLCIKQGKIKDSSKSIVCLPNRVVVLVENYKNNEYDSVAQ